MNLIFIDLLKRNPEYFRDNVEIASVYGCFPPAIWNGGRAISGVTPENVVERYIHEFNARNVPLRYTFTNPNITEEHLSDRFCNLITQLAHNGFNEVIVNVQVLEDYIRKTYPKYPIISTTIKQIEGLAGLETELGKNYKLVVLDYNWNNDFEKLATIPDKERCEILINPYCTPHCKRRGEHYKFMGRIQLTGLGTPTSTAMTEAASFNCPFLHYNFYKARKFPTHVSADDLYTKYVDMGFSNFKIEGRGFHPFNVLESYIYYLIKPERADELRLKMLTYLASQPYVDSPIAATVRRFSANPTPTAPVGL
jgi:collagenase-like PrtC family protease